VVERELLEANVLEPNVGVLCVRRGEHPSRLICSDDPPARGLDEGEIRSRPARRVEVDPDGGTDPMTRSTSRAASGNWIVASVVCRGVPRVRLFDSRPTLSQPGRPIHNVTLQRQVETTQP
jgi:hypothetical protein